MAGVKLGFWLKTESNYPCLLSRTVAEKWRDVAGLEVYMALVATCWPRTLCVTLLDCPAASAEVRWGRRCCCRAA